MRSCLVAEDHEMMREALVGMVRQGWPDSAIAAARDFPEAWRSARESYDMCLCDLDMPGSSPMPGIARLRAEAPDTPLLVITALDDDATLLALLDLGVAGFAPKSSPSRVIDAAIRLILAGGRYLPPRVAELAGSRGDTVPAPALSRLTDRQIEILRHIGAGLSNKEIARLVDLSPATVKAHAGVAFAALGAANRAEAVLRARDRGLI